MQNTKTILLTALLTCALAYTITYILSLTSPPPTNPPTAMPPPNTTNPLILTLHAALPTSLHLPSTPSYTASQTSYWSLLATENNPACILRPTTTTQLSTAIKIFKAAYDEDRDGVRFAVRSGGHSPEKGWANIDGGVLVDLSLLNSVVVGGEEEEGEGVRVRVGVGARWRDVYQVLDGMGLGMVGGRNADVGVGGLVLGGGVSFFSPRFGMVCDNVEEYEIVLADGTIANVTATSHPDLWRALKGGTSNFGIVTHIKAKTFVAGKIWAGYVYWAQWQAPKVLKAFYEFNLAKNFDEFASGPILALFYVQKLGVRAVASSIVYTKPEKWPKVFQGFGSIWRLWSTTKIQHVTPATEELDSLSKSGQRQFQVTTTIKNDLDTILEFSDLYTQGLERVKGVKGGIWTLVYQPLSAAVTRKGSPNVLGLESRDANTTLLIVLLCVVWEDAKDDEFVFRVSREIIDELEHHAKKKGTSDPYKYLNYAASGQNVFDGYGETNKQFMFDVSAKYDPNQFFQNAKRGGFHLYEDSTKM